MRHFLTNLKTTFLTGMMFLFPFYVILYFLVHLWDKLQEFALRFVDQLIPVKIIGVTMATLIAILALILLIGIGVSFLKLGFVSSWLDVNIMRHLPFYNHYIKLVKSRTLTNEGDQQRSPAWLKVGNHQQLVTAVGQPMNGKQLVVCYYHGDEYGKVLLVPEADIEKINIRFDQYEDILEDSGNGEFTRMIIGLKSHVQ